MSAMLVDRRRSMGSLLIVAAILAATFYFLGRGADWTILPQALAHARWQWLAAAVGCMVVFFGAQAMNNHWLLQALGYKVTIGQSTRYTLLDFYFSAITPCASGGQPAQLYFMQKDGIAVGSASLAILLFNMTYHVAAVLLVGGAFLYRGSWIMAQLGTGGLLLLYGVIVHVALIVLFAAAIFKPQLLQKLLLGVIGGLGRIRLLKQPERAEQWVREQIEQYQQGAEYIRGHLGLLLRCQLLTIVHLAALFSVPFCIYCALQGGALNWLEISSLQAVLSAAVDTLPLPGGVGAAEGGFVLMYQAIFAAQVLPAMLLCRTVSYYGVVALSSLVAVASSRR